MVEIMTTMLALASMLYGPSAEASMANVHPDIADKSQTVVSQEIDTNNIVDNVALQAPITNNPDIIEEVVRVYFKNTPILAEIAGCESRFRHIGDDGEIIKGEINKNDIGVMQINKYYHADGAKRLGLDLTTLSGNLAYAKWLYEREGVSPWLSSAKCWDKYKNIARSN